jgi:hypothetical protein
MGDSLQEALFDTYVGAPMAITAENLAEVYKISREDADDYGFRSQTAWLTAHNEGRYAQELTPVVVKDRKGEITVSVDEHPQLSPLAPREKPRPLLPGGHGQAPGDLQEGRHGHRRQRLGHQRRRRGLGDDDGLPR